MNFFCLLLILLRKELLSLIIGRKKDLKNISISIATFHGKIIHSPIHIVSSRFSWKAILKKEGKVGKNREIENKKDDYEL